MIQSKEEQFATEWMDKIKSGKEFRQKYSTYDKWEEFRRQYRNHWKDGVKAVNKIFSYGRMMVPKTYFNSPKVTVTASHPAFTIHARVVEAIDNMLIRETNLKEVIKDAIQNAFLCGKAVIKLGFDSEFGYLPEQAITPDGETLTQVSKKDGERIEYKEGVKPGMPWAISIDPSDVVVPWGSSSNDKELPWIAHRIIRPLKDILEDQKYKNTENLKGTLVVAADDRAAAWRPTTDKDKQELCAEIWEVRDYKAGKIYAFCEDTQILGDDDILQSEGLPYEFLTFNKDPQYFWGIPDADILQNSQKELNDISTQLSKHRALTLIKFLYKIGAVKEEELLKFLDGGVGTAVGLSDVENLASAIMEFKASIPPELFTAFQHTINTMREEIGFSSNEAGDFQPGSPKSASEVMTVANSNDQRISERRDIVSDLVARIVRKWNQYIFQFWTSDKVIQIVGQEGGESWIQYTGDELKGEYFINVDTDSGMPVTKALKYQMGQDLLAKFGGDPLIDQVKLRQIVLDSYSSVDPRVTQLLAMPQGLDPRLIAAARQPSPMGAGAGGGKGAGGGRSGGANEFTQGQARFNASKGKE